LLKAFAISVLSVVGFPSVIISVILWVLLLRLAASLRISHVLFEFCWRLVIVHNIQFCVSWLQCCMHFCAWCSCAYSQVLVQQGIFYAVRVLCF
jgi:hypothetical protein